MSKQLVRAPGGHGSHGWRAAIGRILANALLVLLAYVVVSMGAVVAEMLLTGWTPPAMAGEGATPGLEGVPFMLYAALFLLVRWLSVLPGLLPVLVGIEGVARRVPHARVVTAIVAFTPMVLWELTQESTHPSGFGLLLGVTAVLFAFLARLPARYPVRSTEAVGAAPPPTEIAVAPR